MANHQMTTPLTESATERPKHTPTPWFISRDPRPEMHWNNHIACAAEPNREICAMFHDDTDENELGEANAALIVTAVNEHEKLKARIAELEALLEPFAHEARTWVDELGEPLPDSEIDSIPLNGTAHCNREDFRAANAALQSKGK